jgi:hypothetical protein
MPISEKNKKLYPAWWKYLSYWVRAFRAEWHCECKGECGHNHRNANYGASKRCFMLDYRIKGSAVLTVAHLDHDPTNNMESNLRAFCEGCHNRYDRTHRNETRRKTYDKKHGRIKLL